MEANEPGLCKAGSCHRRQYSPPEFPRIESQEPSRRRGRQARASRPRQLTALLEAKKQREARRLDVQSTVAKNPNWESWLEYQLDDGGGFLS